jgi:hypothetical protein
MKLKSKYLWDMAESKWVIAPHQKVKLTWSSYYESSGWEAIRVRFEDASGNKLDDGAWFNSEKMSKEQLENAIHRARHLVSVIAGTDAWKEAGSVKELGREKFLRNLAAACNKSAGKMFNIKTVFEMGQNGTKRPRLGKTLRFISSEYDTVGLSYSDEERENTRLILNNN